MIKRVLSKLRKVTMSLFAVLCAGAVCAEDGAASSITKVEIDGGYKVTGLGENGDEVAVVFTDTSKAHQWVAPANLSNVQFLVVGGGGGGGADTSANDAYSGGGGGGGGGVVAGVVSFAKGTTVTVAVGAGGAGGTGATKYSGQYGAAASGVNSSFSTPAGQQVVANGGGGSGGLTAQKDRSKAQAGAAGGSSAGGRSKSKTAAGSIANATKGTAVGVVSYVAMGNKGGSSTGSQGYYVGGGGGGAMSAGSPTADGQAGAGGQGYESYITGERAVYGSGGGGAKITGTGAKGGEGAGDGNPSALSDGMSALPNQGGGGGGAGRADKGTLYKGGNGGSGIVVFRYTVYPAEVNDVPYASFAEAFAAAQDGDTVNIYQDVKLSEILVINKAITLDGNGCTLTSTAARAINVSGVDGVIIKNLTISTSGERAINVIQGATNVKIENVTATAYNYTVNIASSAANAVVAINNSTLNGLCTVNVAAAGAKVTIDGSTVNCNDNNTNVGESYAALCLGKEAVGASIVATNTVVNVTEGSDSVKARNGAENGTITIDDSTDNVTEAVAVISYAGQNFYHSFDTLEDAIGFAKDADTITILKDIATDVAFTVAKKVTIDLNGKTIATTENDKVGDGVFCVIAGGELTINDSVGTGTVNGVGGNAYNIAIWANGGKVVINGGTYTNVGAKDDGPDGAHFDLIYVKNGGSVVINGGTFKCQTPNWTLNSHDTAKGTIVVNGGTFYQFNPANCATEGANTNFCADGLCGYVVETVDGVDVYGVAAAVAAVGEAKFASLDAAIAAAGAEDEVVVVADIATDAAFEITKKVTINLNGKTIATTQADTEGNGVFWVKAGGELTLNGEGTVNGVGGNAYNIAIWADGGKVIINGGTYTNEGAQDDGPDGAHFDLIYVKNGGAVEINGGTFKCQTPEWTLNSHDSKKGTIVVNGGLFYQFNPSDCATEGAGTNWCAEGLKGAESAENAGYYEIVDAWTAPMPEKDGEADITEEYTSDVLAALESAVATSVDVKVNGVELKGNEAVKALNTAVKCFEGALVFDGTAADLDIVIEVVEVNVENPAASKVVVKRGETVLAVKTGVTPTVKYVDLGSDAVTFKIVFE